MPDTRVSDAVVLQVNTEKLVPLVNHESPVYNKIRDAAKKKKVNSKGDEMTSSLTSVSKPAAAIRTASARPARRSTMAG